MENHLIRPLNQFNRFLTGTRRLRHPSNRGHNLKTYRKAKITMLLTFLRDNHYP